MENIKEVFGSFSVSDTSKAKIFYGDTLGLDVEEGKMGLVLHMVGGGTIYLYPKETHEPATFTVLNIEVADVEAAVDELTQKGVHFERYDGMGQDDKGIARGKTSGHGPDICWFKDPFGNILALLQR